MSFNNFEPYSYPWGLLAPSAVVISIAYAAGAAGVQCEFECSCWPQMLDLDAEEGTSTLWTDDHSVRPAWRTDLLFRSVMPA